MVIEKVTGQFFPFLNDPTAGWHLHRRGCVAELRLELHCLLAAIAGINRLYEAADVDGAALRKM